MSRLVACACAQKHASPRLELWVPLRMNPASHHIGVFDRIVEVNGQAGPGKDMVTQQQCQRIWFMDEDGARLTSGVA